MPAVAKEEEKGSWMQQLEGMLDEMDDDDRAAGKFGREKQTEDLTWAGSMTGGATVDDTVAAAGHPDAEEVMKGEMEALKPSPATKFPHADDMSKATTLDEAEPVTDRAAGSRNPKGETDSATELPNEDLTWAGRVAEGSSAEATAAAAGHSDAAEVMVDDLSTRITEPDENLSPVDRMTKESNGDDTTVVEGDQDLQSRSLRRQHWYPRWMSSCLTGEFLFLLSSDANNHSGPWTFASRPEPQGLSRMIRYPVTWSPFSKPSPKSTGTPSPGPSVLLKYPRASTWSLPARCGASSWTRSCKSSSHARRASRSFFGA